MLIDSIQPTKIEGIAQPKRHMLPTKKQAGELQSDPEVRNTPPEKTAGSQETVKALHDLGQEVEQFNVSLKFSRDEDTGTIVVEMIDQTSGETLLQFPSEARLQVAATLTKLQGKIFNVQV